MFPRIQGGGAISLQGGSANAVQKTTSNPQLTVGTARIQPAVNPMNVSTGQAGGGAAPQGLTNTAVAQVVDPAVAAAQAKAAADAVIAGRLRGEITNIANSIKDIFNQRYGQVDAAAQEQTGKLNTRFANESADVTNQVEGENQKLGAAHAAGGSYDSSYRGNNVDTVTQAGEGQIRDLGTELEDNLAGIGGWAVSQKAGFDAQKGGIDAVVRRLGESTDPAELTSIRNSLDSRINELRAGNADNNTMSQNRGALEKIAPSSARAQQLKTTLSKVVAGSADVNAKSAIANKLVQSAGLSPEDSQALLTAFQGDLLKQEQA